MTIAVYWDVKHQFKQTYRKHISGIPGSIIVYYLNSINIICSLAQCHEKISLVLSHSLKPVLYSNMFIFIIHFITALDKEKDYVINTSLKDNLSHVTKNACFQHQGIKSADTKYSESLISTFMFNI